MVRVNNAVINLIKVLYEEYNRRPLASFPSFGLYFELVYVEENLTQLLNLVYKELSELEGKEYSHLSTLKEVKNFAKSKGFLNLESDDNETFLEESLVELCSARLRTQKRLVKNLDLPFKNDTLFDDYVLGKLNEFKLSDLDDTPVESKGSKKRQLNTGQFEDSQVEELSRLSDELSKDYFSRWNSYLDRFYNLLDVFFKVKEFKDTKEYKVLMETLKVWRKNTEFRELNLYDVSMYKPDESSVTKISSDSSKASRVVDMYNKTKLELK